MNIALAMLNIFIDPKASVDRFAGKKFAWVAPVLLMGVVTAVISWLTVPIVIRIMMLNPPEGVRPDELEQSIGMITVFQKVGSVFSPVAVAVMLLLSAAVLLATCSIMDIKATLGGLYNLVAFCSLVSFVQAVATGVVVYQRRDDIQNFAELQPAFGLNLLLPEGSNRDLGRISRIFFDFHHLVYRDSRVGVRLPGKGAAQGKHSRPPRPYGWSA